MPTNRTKRSRTGNRLDYWKIDHLVTGMFWGIAGVGYAEDTDHGWNHLSESEKQQVYDLARADWAKVGAEFMGWWRGETEQFTATYASIGGKRRDPSVTPWALTQFGEPTCNV